MEPEKTTTAGAPIMGAAGETKAGFNAMLIVVILTLIVLAAAGWVLMKDTGMPMDGDMPMMSGGTMPGGDMMIEQDPATEQMKVQGTSDEVTAIEADLNATNFDSLQEIDQI